METTDSAEVVQQETSMGEGSSGGMSGAAEPQGSEVSAAEPSAPAEPTQESAPAADTADTESAPEAFPGVDSFDWDSWDGENYESFPEQIRPWTQKVYDYHQSAFSKDREKYATESNYWQRMYEALQYGEEDPRIGDLNTQVTTLQDEKSQIEAQMQELQTSLNAEREAENDRYFSWFEKNYQGQLENLANTYGAEKAEQMVLDLMDLDMDVHVAVEVSLLGEQAYGTAKELAKKVQDPELILEVIKSRFSGADKTTKAVETKAEEKPKNPATQVVAGSAPVSRPAQLAREKAPSYGADRNQRMASLMSAAENAIRKSKRR